MRGLDGKTAIVTGGATIIGHAVVRALHEHGARVVLADIDDVGGKQVADELGPGVRFEHTDITDDDAVARCVAAAVERFGGVDILVNLACSYVDEASRRPVSSGPRPSTSTWRAPRCSLRRSIPTWWPAAAA